MLDAIFSVLIDLIVVLSIIRGFTSTVRLTNPLDLTSILPLALLLNTLLADVGADSMLLASFPLADIFATILPNKGSMAFALVIHELATVHFTVLPLELALTVHFVLAPVTGI